MWIPVITILWSLGETSAFVNFPMVNFPFTTESRCYEYVNQVRNSIMQDPQYIEGYSVCVEIPLKGEST
jgi:hypothetical protein|tara:strand:+ start:2700 stop:2906 length:207 start_codon:yes stop_codon:yes gene_type:complete